MHFDVVTDRKGNESAIRHAKKWLASIGEEGARVTAEECRFCHPQTAPDEVESGTMTDGYHIARMEWCPQRQKNSRYKSTSCSRISSSCDMLSSPTFAISSSR